MSVFWLVLLKPFLLVAFFGLVVLPLAWLADRLIPNGRIKTVLYDQTLFERKKWLAWLSVALAYVVLGLWASLFY